MRVLAIETSCDETGIAIVEGTKTDSGEGFVFTLLGAAALNSQAKLHAEYGGVYPNLAKREHEKNLPIILVQALIHAQPKFARENSLARSSSEDEQGRTEDFFEANFGEAIKTLGIDAIAVTQGPGLEPALWAGIVFAEKLAQDTGLPLLLTNHMEGHLFSSLAQSENSTPVTFALKDVQLPVLALLISGGHSEFVLMKDWFEYAVIGETQDDAVGEAFDKVARMLGLPYPGGPEISKLANETREKSLSHKGPRVSSLADNLPVGKARPDHLLNNSSLSLPRPMLNSGNLDLSFSGLKTAVLYALRDRGGIHKLSKDDIALFACEFENAVGDVLIAKTRRALDETGAQTFVIGGGVAANTYLRERLATFVQSEFPDVVLRLPDLSITGDNGVMIAEAALARALSGLDDTPKGEVRAYSNRFSILAPK
jgi:N6-L-threonylcarbamoyladenine synthase